MLYVFYPDITDMYSKKKSTFELTWAYKWELFTVNLSGKSTGRKADNAHLSFLF